MRSCGDEKKISLNVSAMLTCHSPKDLEGNGSYALRPVSAELRVPYRPAMNITDRKKYVEDTAVSQIQEKCSPQDGYVNSVRALHFVQEMERIFAAQSNARYRCQTHKGKERFVDEPMQVILQVGETPESLDSRFVVAALQSLPIPRHNETVCTFVGFVTDARTMSFSELHDYMKQAQH